MSDLEGALALWDLALTCTEDEDALLTPCIADAAPTGNLALCEESVCVAVTPAESCLSMSNEDTSTESEDVDAGPEEDTVSEQDGEGPEAD